MHVLYGAEKIVKCLESRQWSYLVGEQLQLVPCYLFIFIFVNYHKHLQFNRSHAVMCHELTPKSSKSADNNNLYTITAIAMMYAIMKKATTKCQKRAYM